MVRPQPIRRGSSRRPSLEKLEDRNLPGEALLSAIAAGVVADQLRSVDPYFAPPMSLIDANDLRETISDSPAAAVHAPDSPPTTDSTTPHPEQPRSGPTTIDAAFLAPDEFGQISPTQFGALFSTPTPNTGNTSEQDSGGTNAQADGSANAGHTSFAVPDRGTTTGSDKGPDRQPDLPPVPDKLGDPGQQPPPPSRLDP